MSKKFSSQNNSDLTTEACAWIAQLESECMSSDDLAAFKEWVERSPAHIKEIKRLAHLSFELNVLTDMVIPLRAAAERQRKFSILNLKVRRPNLHYLTGVVCLVAYFFFSSFWLDREGVFVSEPLLYTTEVGGHRKILLSDGTLLDLNTDSEIEVDYSLGRRKVRLLKGEAFFEVSHDINRPFIVYAGETSVRAVGTAFVVRLMSEKFEVTVTEGKIEISQTSLNEKTVNDKENYLAGSQLGRNQLVSKQEKSIYLEAGEKVVYNKSYQNLLQEKLIETMSKGEIKRMLSWQDGLFEFSDTPLVEVIRDLSRYTSMKIEISDPKLRELKFGGLFRTNELQALFDALETTFDVVIERNNDNHVIISRNKTVKIEI